MGSPVSPIVANLYMEYLEQKVLSTAPHPLVSGAGMWMPPLLSARKSINKASSNTLTLSLLPLSHSRPPPHAAGFSSIDCFVLKLLLHVYMGSKCSSSLYEAFQMEDKSCKGKGPMFICRTSFYLLTEVKLGMIKLKTFLVHTQA